MPRDSKPRGAERPQSSRSKPPAKRGRARAVLDRPPGPQGWRTTDDDEIALRRWRGTTDIVAIEDVKVLNVAPLTQHGTPLEILRQFGGKEAYVKAVRELEDELHRAS